MVKKQEPVKESFYGLSLLLFSFILFLSLLSYAYGHSTNWFGLVGSYIGWFFHALFGIPSYLVALFLGWWGSRRLFHKSISKPYIKALFLSLSVLSLCMLLSVLECSFPPLGNALRHLFYPSSRFHLGGAPSYYLCFDITTFNLHHILNKLGIVLLFTSTLLVSFLYLAKISLYTILNKIKELFTKQETITELETVPSSLFSRFVKLRTSKETDLLAIQPETDLKVRPTLTRKTPVEPPPEVEKPKTTKKREQALAAQRVYNGDFTGYILPPPTLLTTAKKVDQNLLKKDLRKQAEVLEETLQSFGIEAKVGQINCGPTITSFEVHPAIGVKVQRIKALENDIALNMEAKSIRIIAPIPGKAAVGIEVPNPLPQEVSFKELLQAYLQSGKKFNIPVLLGKAVNGDNVMSDLTKMPHCIIAGATGSGKSVCINTIVMSILMTTKPDEVKLIMVDPKKVELTPYTRLPHMLAPVITEAQGAYTAMTWLVKEMEARYDVLKLTGARNIETFNNRNIDKELEASLNREIPQKFPYIVGIIDELADLMMSSSHDIETPIARIAQMARAVGIHLVLATQRPSREVITGLIKANFPTRISFKVASRINSQIVLDEIGAETLLGNGDMLFLPPGASHLIRAQGAFIRDEDIYNVIKQITDQAPTNYVVESFDKMEWSSEDIPALETDTTSGDSLYKSALDLVLGTGNASTTFLQRKLKVGYARAASLIDELEVNGIVSPAEGSKPRKILVTRPGAQEPSEEEINEDP